MYETYLYSNRAVSYEQDYLKHNQIAYKCR